jgi:hypothetical protein
MYIQCKTEWWKGLCEDFADLYYTVVHTIGGKRSLEIAELEENFRKEVEALQAAGYDPKAKNVDVTEA